MINLSTYEAYQHTIFENVTRINRLEAILAKLNEFQDLIFDAETRADISNKADEVVDELQAPLEELTAAIETEIRDTKSDVDNWNSELRNKIFLDTK